MSTKRLPISSSHLSRIVYPSALFSLERDETLPYERFAYGILGLAIEVLHDKRLPEDVTISFGTGEASRFAPWRINAGIICRHDANRVPSSFEFIVPELLPGIAFLYCFRFATKFVQQPPQDVRAGLYAFLNVVNAGVKAYKTGGIAAALRAAYDESGFLLTDENLHSITMTFDLLAKQIGYHEVAHAYANLLGQKEENPVRRRAYELVADLLATQWLYRGVIVHTPDLQAYRERYGYSSHAEAIYTNCQFLQRSYFALLGLFALSGAQTNEGRVTLDGGTTHPPGMQRHMLLHTHFSTLVRSNYSNVLSISQLTALDQDWSSMFGLFYSAGIIPDSDVQAFLDPREADTLEAAADVIESKGITELKHAIHLLRDSRELIAKVVSQQPRR